MSRYINPRWGVNIHPHLYIPLHICMIKALSLHTVELQLAPRKQLCRAVTHRSSGIYNINPTLTGVCKYIYKYVLMYPTGVFWWHQNQFAFRFAARMGGVNPVRFPGLSIRPQGLGPGIHPPPRPAVVIGFVALLEEVLGQMLGHEDGHVPEDIAC